MGDNIRDIVNSRNAGSNAELASRLDSMFGLDKPKTLVSLPLNCLHPYQGDPFRDRPDDEFIELTESIKKNGLIYPIIVRPMEDTGQYQILAGRRRVNAYKHLGETHIEALSRDADDDQAVMIVTETNLRNRKNLYPSEKAYAYKLQVDAIKSQGKRSDSKGLGFGAQIGYHGKSVDVVALLNDVDKHDIQRHIRLINLTPELLDLVDSGKLGFIAGYELSFIPVEQQKHIYQFFYIDKRSAMSGCSAKLLRKAYEKGRAFQSAQDIVEITEKRSVQKRSGAISFKRSTLKPFLSRIPKEDDLEKLFIEFLQSRYG